MCDNKQNKQEKCLKKSNILVYQQPTGERTTRPTCAPKPDVKIPVCEAHPVQICTCADLKKMCPPPKIPAGLRKKRPIAPFRLLGFGVKSAIAAGLIYITYDMGIWGTTDDTHELYATVCSLLKRPQPAKNSNKWDPPSCRAESPLFPNPDLNTVDQCNEAPISIEETKLKLQNVWNSAVCYTCSGIANFPYNLIKKMENVKGFNNKHSDVNTPEKKCIPYSQLPPEEQDELVNNQYKSE